jgi:hypothetical protein
MHRFLIYLCLHFYITMHGHVNIKFMNTSGIWLIVSDIYYHYPRLHVISVFVTMVLLRTCKGAATLEPEPTQHNSLDRLQIRK